MALSLSEIHNKEFSIKFRGYNEDEVNDFLDLIERDYEFFINRIRELEDKNVELARVVESYMELEKSLDNTPETYEEKPDNMILQAEKEYELIIKESEKNADRIVNEALLKQKNIYYEIEDMKRSASAFRTRFRSLLQAELEILDRYNWDVPETE